MNSDLSTGSGEWFADLNPVDELLCNNLTVECLAAFNSTVTALSIPQASECSNKVCMTTCTLCCGKCMSFLIQSL